MNRDAFADGRLVPREGDTVYQSSGGMFGCGQTWYGIVHRNRDGKLRVHLTESASLLGGRCAAGRHRTYPATDGHWTVQGDPEVERRKLAADRERQERETASQKWAEDRKALEAESIRVHGRITPGSLRIGDVLCCVHTGAKATVAEFDERGEAYVTWEGEAEHHAPGCVGSLDGWYLVSASPR